jgi:CheY-like chemotaxis protein/DNA gyrase inhibitor GyrI
MVLAIPMFPNLTEALRTFLQSTLRLMKADAAAVWLISQEGQEQREKELVVSTGFNRDGISKTDEERISRVILEGKMMKIDDLRQSQSVLRTELMAQNGFISYLATPTIVKDAVTGVLEVFYRSPYRGKPGEAELLDAIAKQTCLVVYTVQFLIKAYHRDEPKRTQPQPVQSERSSGVQEFISKTAHELNNVLTIIGGNAQLLKVSMQDEELKENASTIFNEVVKASAITESLLAFVRKQEVREKEVSVDEVPQKTIELKFGDFNSNKTRRVEDLDSPVPLALIDPNQLHLTGEVPKEISGKHSKQSSWLHGKKGLLIDDDVQLMNLLSRFFETEGCETEVVPDGKSALDKLNDSSYDFIFCDIKMPTMNGITLYQQLKEKSSPHLGKIIFVTGDVTGYDVKEFLESVRNPILVKPFDLEEVKRTVLQMLTRP